VPGRGRATDFTFVPSTLTVRVALHYAHDFFHFLTQFFAEAS